MRLRITANQRQFLQYVIPSIIAFALSGVYAIVDGFFVGHVIGDAGLSAINIAYPVVALIQSIGTGIGMGGAVCYSIASAEGKHTRARHALATTGWLLIAASALLTIGVIALARPMLAGMGAQGDVLDNGAAYLRIIGMGAALQTLGTGLIPVIRNFGGAFWAMLAMVFGFVTNVALDYELVWVHGMGMMGAAVATVIGQGVTAVTALAFAASKNKLTLAVSYHDMADATRRILTIGLAPFGLAMAPNVSLVLINRFSAQYGGQQAIADYACISYIVCIVYLVLQGVGDGSQPLMSQHYGRRDAAGMRSVERMAYAFSLLLALVGCVAMYATRGSVGTLFGSSPQVNADVARIMPIFLVSFPFVAVTRITTSFFYATEKNRLSYILTFMEPLVMLAFMLVLPPLVGGTGGQTMIWWSTVLARVVSAMTAVALKRQADRTE